jgi:hypothetical protein
MGLFSQIKQVLNTAAVWPADDDNGWYKLYEVSIFGVLKDTNEANMSLDDTATHINKLLQEGKTVYIQKRHNNGRRSLKRNALIKALQDKDTKIQVPLANNSSNLMKWTGIFTGESKTFLMIQKDQN